MAYAFCDMQLLRGADDEYIIKEFSVYNSQWDITRGTAVFSAPYAEIILTPEQRRCNRYVTRHIHGLAWDAGSVPYEEYRDTIRALTRDYRYLYIKGREKKLLLIEIVPDAVVIDIEALGCPRLTLLPKLFVPFHGPEHSVTPLHSCACLNARRIGYWYEFAYRLQ